MFRYACATRSFPRNAPGRGALLRANGPQGFRVIARTKLSGPGGKRATGRPAPLAAAQSIPVELFRQRQRIALGQICDRAHDAARCKQRRKDRDRAQTGQIPRAKITERLLQAKED